MLRKSTILGNPFFPFWARNKACRSGRGTSSLHGKGKREPAASERANSRIPTSATASLHISKGIVIRHVECHDRPEIPFLIHHLSGNLPACRWHFGWVNHTLAKGQVAQSCRQCSATCRSSTPPSLVYKVKGGREKGLVGWLPFDYLIYAFVALKLSTKNPSLHTSRFSH